MKDSKRLLDDNPYVGPLEFREEDQDRYFGREAEARALLALVVNERLTVFYAQSGAGKSSLINARLVPMLRREGFMVLPIGHVSGVLPPQITPESVANIYVYHLIFGLSPEPTEQSAVDPAGLVNTSLARFLNGETGPDPALPTDTEGIIDKAEEDLVPHVLIIDQFEELMSTHPERWSERADFFEQLRIAMEYHSNLWIVLTLREDYIAGLEPYAHLVPNRLRARFYMQRMGKDEALDAIRKPAELGGRPFAPGVAEKLVDDLRQVRVPGQKGTVPGQYVEPVQLQVVCYQLWENIADQSPGLISASDLREAGDVDRALTQFYEETLAYALAVATAAGISERQLRTWFDTELITEAGTRGLVPQGVDDTGGLPNEVVRVLHRRFLVRAEARGGDTWIELVHDRFVEPIRGSNAAWFLQHLSALQARAALWHEEGRKSGLLLQDQALDEAEDWAKAHEPELEPHEREFLAACRKARGDAKRERRQSRLIRMGLVAAAVAVIALVTAIYSLAQSRTIKERTLIAVELLGSQARFLEHVEAQEFTDDILLSQRQQLEQAASLLTGGTAPRVAIPDLQGTSYLDALQQLAQACEPRPCLRSQVQWEANDEMTGGLVLRSEPAAGTELLWGTLVTLIVSPGPPFSIESPVSMTLVPIPEGEFLMGSDPARDPDAVNAQRQDRIPLNEFYIGKHEVTNDQYAAFVEATGHSVPSHWEGGSVPVGEEDHPAVYVDWYDAVAFTQWLSEETGFNFRLCTEAEWEKACRATEGLIYPWGDSFDASKANTLESRIGKRTQVGSYSPQGDSPYGVADMAGNVWEWASSLDSDYPYNAEDGREDLTISGKRVLRGGAFNVPSKFARCASRASNDPGNALDYGGFRVCYAAPLVE